jgi:hypothetical protein
VGNLTPTYIFNRKNLVDSIFFRTFASQKTIKGMKAVDIIWETDGEEIDLPTEVELPSDFERDDEDAITDYLSDEYGWLVISYEIEA